MRSHDETDEGKGAMGFPSTVDRGVAFFICGAIECVLLFFLTYAVAKGQLTLSVLIVFGALLSFFAVIHLMLLIYTSELLVSESGIARKFLGRSCLRIPWDGIRCIRERFVSSPKGSVTTLQIIPSSRSSWDIRFSDRIERFDELVEILNVRIQRHSIRVEINSTGLWQRRPQLVKTGDS
jgi:hypothetical protein